ncbi:MAG: PocR ligand-binding domain-containing protein [Synergistaceae bacterium]|nr:PocR ligand-binding domain-containing protein [Synergistaceae bacterium]
MTLKLSDVISPEELQEIQDCFASATGFAAITVDFQGRPLLKYSSFSNFCAKLREDGAYNDRCRQSDAHAGLEAVRSGGLCIHRCHGGLIDFAVPIVVDGEYLATFMCGQVRSNDFGDVETRLIQPDGEIFKKRPALIKLYDEIPTLSAERIRATARLLEITVNAIVEQSNLRRGNALFQEESRRKADLERAKDDLEIRLLHSDVRPHFVFNALNTAGRQARLEGAQRTEDLIYSLADMCRYSMKNSGPLVTVEQELQNLRNYFFIQKARFGDLLSFDIEAEPEICGCLVPTMSLQIFAENSMRHGLEKKNDMGYIKIVGEKRDGRMSFEIEDNGTGIDKGLMARLNDTEGIVSATHARAGSGIYNLCRRLKYFFGDDFKVTFSEKPQNGVIVRIDLPTRPLRLAPGQPRPDV